MDDYKVAVASTDGETINQHYGRASQFYIYSIDEEGYDLLEIRKTAPACKDGAHSEAELKQSAQNLKDCRYIIVSRIGSGAAAVLTSVGLTAMELPGTIDDAMLRVWKYNQIQNLFN